MEPIHRKSNLIESQCIFSISIIMIGFHSIIFLFFCCFCCCSLRWALLAILILMMIAANVDSTNQIVERVNAREQCLLCFCLSSTILLDLNMHNTCIFDEDISRALSIRNLFFLLLNRLLSIDTQLDVRRCISRRAISMFSDFILFLTQSVASTSIEIYLCTMAFCW